MSTENLLDKLKSNGLSQVWSIYPWQEGNKVSKMYILFDAAKRAKTTSYLSKQIEIAVCKTCPLKGNGCTAVKVDSFNQILAEIKSDFPLDIKGWRAKLSNLPCKSELIK